jgi:AAA15 family ATPase/GTPase
MKLVSLSVSNYRSITKAHQIDISDTTVLIGKNNEGKSNILKALNVGMVALQQHADKSRKEYGYFGYKKYRDERLYFWERDFPVLLQEKKSGSKKTTLKFEFELDEEEISQFKEEIGSNLNGSLPIDIIIGIDNIPDIKVTKKRGKGGAALNSKSSKIADFVGKSISFNYIPAVRTDQQAMSVVSGMLEQRLSKLETDVEYKAALDTIKSIQEPVLEEIARQIEIPLKQFLPNINNVNILIEDERRRSAVRRDFEIVIDDGTPTSILYKGDGVKSLAALALLKSRVSDKAASIIAIEEPESHLHPGAIHQLKEIIEVLGVDNQVVLTTHNPLFVDRFDIQSNIIVDSGKAKPAKKIDSIRELLGIRASDNLVNANHVLIVEGSDDVIALKAILTEESPRLAAALKNHELVIDEIGGASNLSYKLSILENSLCLSHTFLDDDDAGRKAFEKAEEAGILKLKDNTFISIQGRHDTEFEDCLNVDLYKDAIKDEFGVTLTGPKFNSKKKWSDRVEDVFKDRGKLWNSRTESQVKLIVANLVKDNPQYALNEHKRNSIDALIENLEELLG